MITGRAADNFRIPTMKEYPITVPNSVDAMWDELVGAYGVSTRTLQVVTAINGYSVQTMQDVLYAVAGLRGFDQAEEDDNDD